MIASPLAESAADDPANGDAATPIAFGVTPLHARRVSVVCGRHCVDVTLPAHEPVSTMLGSIAEIFFEHIRSSPGAAEGSLIDELCGPGPHGAWQLSRIGGDVVAGEQTLAQAGVVDGYPLVLAAPPVPTPPPLWDDSLAALAEQSSANVWQAADSRRASALLVAGIGALLGAVLTVGFLRGPTDATSAVAIVAAVASLAFTVIFRAHGAGPASAVTGIGFAGGFAFLAAAAFVPGSPGALHIVSGASATLLLCTLGAATAVLTREDDPDEDPTGSHPLERDIFCAGAVLSVLALVGGVLVRWAGLEPVQIGVGIGTIGWGLCLAAPSIAVAFSALPLPGATVESPAAPDPLDMADVQQFSARATRLLLAGVSTSSICVVGGAVVATMGGQNSMWTLAWALVLTVWLLLRVRTVPSRTCGIVCMTAGAATLLVAASTAFWNTETLVWMSVFAILAIAVSAIVAAAGWWVPGKEFSPTTRRAVDVVDVIITCSAIPLALCAAGVVQAVRG